MIAGDGSGSLAWKSLSERRVYEGAVFSVVERTSEGPGGRRGVFSVIEAHDWAVVVPYLSCGDIGGGEHPGSGRTVLADSFIMVRQYRHGAESSSLEFPGGVVENGEDPAAAAARELAEETGFVASDLVHAGSLFPNPAIQGNFFHVYVAIDPRREVERNLDEHEVLDAFLVPAEEVFASMGKGEMRHALMASALLLAQRVLEERGLLADRAYQQQAKDHRTASRAATLSR